MATAGVKGLIDNSAPNPVKLHIVVAWKR